MARGGDTRGARDAQKGAHETEVNAADADEEAEGEEHRGRDAQRLQHGGARRMRGACEVPSPQASVALHAAQLTSQQAACTSATVRSRTEACVVSLRARAVPGPHGDWRSWSAQVHGAGSRNTAFFMAHMSTCVLF